MRTSFGFEAYRDDLAGKLRRAKKEVGTEEARILLTQEKKSDAYNVSKDLKLLSKKQLSLPEHSRSEIESSLVVEEYDISELIPGDIKIAIDKMRINALQEEGDVYGNQYNKSAGGFDKKKGQQVNYYKPELKAALDKLINRITEGKFASKEVLSTTIHGYEPTGNKRNSYVRLSEQTILEDKKSGIDLLQEVPTSYDGDTAAWFSAGGNEYIEPHKLMVLVDKKSQRFLSRIEFIRFFSGEDEYDYDEEEYYSVYKGDDWKPTIDFEGAFQYAASAKDQGVKISFKKGTHWSDVADMIVSLPEGKLYRVKSSEEQSLT